MGFLDDAKNRLANSFADETVKEVAYKEDDNNDLKVKRERKPVEVAPRPQKPVKPVNEKIPKVKNHKEKTVRSKTQKPAPKKMDKPSKPQRTLKRLTEKIPVKNPSSEVKEIAPKESEIEKYQELLPTEPQNNRFKDVLEVLNIPETFAIESNVFLPEDIHIVEFDVQTPYGYEQGQVEAFVEQTKVTVKRYVDLLKLRNEHVAKLATVVDRLQVDMNNIKYENEIASGINIMATSDDDLENQFFEAKLKIKRLEDIINENKMNGTNENKEKIDALKDQISLLNRENTELSEENFELKNKLAVLVENEDYGDDKKVNNSEFFNEQSESFELPSIEILEESKERKLYSLDDEDDELDRVMKNWDN